MTVISSSTSLDRSGSLTRPVKTESRVSPQREEGTKPESVSNEREEIRDEAKAQEVAKTTRVQILKDAGTAILAQANQQVRVVLDLLR
jgi:flagellin-like hook-associated protein FlgL